MPTDKRGEEMTIAIFRQWSRDLIGGRYNVASRVTDDAVEVLPTISTIAADFVDSRDPVNRAEREGMKILGMSGKRLLKIILVAVGFSLFAIWWHYKFPGIPLKR